MGQGVTPAPTMSKAFWLAEIVLQIAVLWRLLGLRLHTVFPLLILWLAADAVAQMLALPVRKEAYWKVWAAMAPVVTGFSFLAAGEIYSRQLRELIDRKKIAWVIAVVVLAVGLAASASVTAPGWGGANQIQGMLIAARRYGYSILFIGLGLALAFFRLFPFRSDRNLAIHARVMLAYLGFFSAGYWAMEWLGRTWVGPIGNALMVVWCGCLLAWGLLLRRQPPDPPAEGDAHRLREEAGEFLRVIRP